MLGNIALIVIMILLNAFFAAAEIAFISVNETRLKLRAIDGNKRAIEILKVIDNPSAFLSAIQIFISFAGLFSGAIAAQGFAETLASWLIDMGVNVPIGVLSSVSLLVITMLLTYFMLVVGELVPKRLAMEKAEGIASIAVYPIKFMTFIATPFVKILSLSTNVVLRLFGIDASKDAPPEVTEEEIRHMMKEESDLPELERERIDNIFEFNDKTAGEVATHRKDILALSIDTPPERVIEAVLESGYSRIPVYRDSIDYIVGILNIKDLFRFILSSDVSQIKLSELMRDPHRVPVSKKTDVLFEEMKKNKVHLAVVIDEYGGTLGIVTMEDLVEEILGSILDEYDDEEAPEIEDKGDGSYSILGSTPLDTVAELFGINLPLDDFDTLSGFIIGSLGAIPDPSEHPCLTINGLNIEVTNIKSNRVETAILRKQEESKNE